MTNMAAPPTVELLARTSHRATALYRALSSTPPSSSIDHPDSPVDVAELAEEFLAEARSAVEKVESLLFEVRTE
jgi:hypothetical protein